MRRKRERFCSFPREFWESTGSRKVGALHLRLTMVLSGCLSKVQGDAWFALLIKILSLTGSVTREIRAISPRHDSISYNQSCEKNLLCEKPGSLSKYA